MNWDNYCTTGSSILCSSIQLGLTPDAGSTAFSIRLRNLEGYLGTTPWALNNVTFDLGTTMAGGFSTPTYQASLSGTGAYLVTADPATCATDVRLGGCPGPDWGDVEWDWRGSGFGSPTGQVGSHIDELPKPLGIVGCDAPPQPSPTNSYWGGGYFQTCGDGWVDFNFTLPGTWMFDEQSKVTILAYDGATFSDCTLDQSCFQQQVTATPEPVTMSLVATGLFAMVGSAGVRRRRARRANA
jgi:hypothetical protein